MRRTALSLSTFAAVTLAFSPLAWAEPASRPSYKASDIVSHFAPVDLGPTRALCIGTESECAKNVVAKPKPASNFDLVVNFEYNSATLTKSARTNLDEFAKALKDPRLDTAAFVVEGHTDGKGGRHLQSRPLDPARQRGRRVPQGAWGRHGEARGPRLRQAEAGRARPPRQHQPPRRNAPAVRVGRRPKLNPFPCGSPLVFRPALPQLRPMQPHEEPGRHGREQQERRRQLVVTRYLLGIILMLVVAIGLLVVIRSV
jgi:hypothetical protein